MSQTPTSGTAGQQPHLKADDAVASSKGSLHIEAIPWAMAATATTATVATIGAAAVGPVGLAAAGVLGIASAAGIWATNRDEVDAVASSAKRGASVKAQTVKTHRDAVRTAKSAPTGRSIGRSSGPARRTGGGRLKGAGLGGGKPKRPVAAARRDNVNRVKAARRLDTKRKAQQGRTNSAALLGSPSKAKTSMAKRTPATGSKPLLAGPTFPPPSRRPATRPSGSKGTTGRSASLIGSGKRTGSTRPRSSITSGLGLKGTGRGLKGTNRKGGATGPRPLTPITGGRDGRRAKSPYYNPPGAGAGHRSLGAKLRHRVWGRQAEAKARHQAKVEKWAMTQLELKAATKAHKTDARWARARFWFANIPDYLLCRIPRFAAQANYRLDQRQQRHDAHMKDLAQRHGIEPDKLGNHLGEDAPITKTKTSTTGTIITTGGNTMATTNNRLSVLIKQAIEAQEALSSYMRSSDEEGMLVWDDVMSRAMPALAQASATTSLIYAGRVEQLPAMGTVKASAADAAKGHAMVVGAMSDIGPIFRRAHAADLERLRNPRGPEEDKWDVSKNK